MLISISVANESNPQVTETTMHTIPRHSSLNISLNSSNECTTLSRMLSLLPKDVVDLDNDLQTMRDKLRTSVNRVAVLSNARNEHKANQTNISRFASNGQK